MEVTILWEGCSNIAHCWERQMQFIQTLGLLLSYLSSNGEKYTAYSSTLVFLRVPKSKLLSCRSFWQGRQKINYGRFGQYFFHCLNVSKSSVSCMNTHAVKLYFKNILFHITRVSFIWDEVCVKGLQTKFTHILKCMISILFCLYEHSNLLNAEVIYTTDKESDLPQVWECVREENIIGNKVCCCQILWSPLNLSQQQGYIIRKSIVCY